MILSQVRDHPRACGEHGIDARYLELTLGSSPRLRGTLQRICNWNNVFGIIPALAGNIVPCAVASRACAGSSPRLRGTLSKFGLPVRLRGIIPALAGNIWLIMRWWLTARDHPRACGEHMEIGHLTRSREGSSPRLRGTFVDAD